MIRVLITGGNGFLGSHVARRLSRRCETIAVVMPGTSRERLSGLDVRVCESDVRNPQDIEQVVGMTRPTAVVHLAAAGVAPGDAAGDIAATNVLGTQHVLMATRHASSVNRVIVAGSWYEYGAALASAGSRTPLPTTPYGISKLASTLLALEAAAQGVPAVVLRPFQLYGADEPPHRLIPQALNAARLGQTLPLNHPGARRDWLHVDDAAAAIEAAIDSSAIGQAIDIGTGRTAAVSEVAATIYRLVGAPVPSVEAAVEAVNATGDAGLSGAADTDTARQLLGWTARIDLAAGLRMIVESSTHTGPVVRN